MDRLDQRTVRDLLDGRWAEVRRATREFLRDERLHHDPALPGPAQRDRLLAQIRLLAERGVVHRGFPRDLGGQDDAGGHVANFEEFVLADPALLVKAGVQWGLFGAAVHHLGTAEHHRRLLPAIMSLEVPGCFAMTETDHGSDVANLRTTATYEPATQEFVLHTPDRGARKDYIGNAARDGVAAVVFARLVTAGRDHGVHAFYTPLRDTAAAPSADGALPFLAGVRGEDIGLKGGLPGVDNGRLEFDRVRIPRSNLLNRFGDVAPDGTYTSPIANPARRFFAMLATLVQGRVSIDGAAVRVTEVALTIAIRYAVRRRQFAGPDGEEVRLLDYPSHRRRLLPLLAETYAQRLAHEELLGAFDTVFSGAADDAARERLETLAAALKPLSSWHAVRVLQEAREACGGVGYLAENRLVSLRADLDVYPTFEGDNTVLLQLVARRLLAARARDLRTPGAKMRFAVGRGLERALERAQAATGLGRLGEWAADGFSSARAVERLLDPARQGALLRGRAEAMLDELVAVAGKAASGRSVGRSGVARSAGRSAAAAVALADRQVDLLRAARAHAEVVQWTAFTAALDRVPDGPTRRVLAQVRDLFGLGLIERDLGWFVTRGRLSARRGRAVGAAVERRLAELRPHAEDLVDAWGLAPEHVRAPIAL